MQSDANHCATSPSQIHHNNAIESTWRWLKEQCCSKNGGTRSKFTVQLIRYCEEKSKLAEDALVRLGHPNVFPFEPVVSRDTWKAIQLMEPDYIQCVHVVKGDNKKFATFVDSVLKSDGRYLYDKLLTANIFDERCIQELLFPTSYTVSRINSDNERRRETARFNATDAVQVYKDLIQSPNSTDLDVVQILKSLSSFHYLKRCHSEHASWSRFIYYTCSCPDL